VAPVDRRMSAAAPLPPAVVIGQSVERLEAYLRREEFDEVYAMLFPHGIEGVGFAPVERWRQVVELGWLLVDSASRWRMPRWCSASAPS
jgi:hypothetical protein